MPPNLIENLYDVLVGCHQAAVVDEVARAEYFREDWLLTCWKGQHLGDEGHNAGTRGVVKL
jgi:hypothetical protein